MSQGLDRLGRPKCDNRYCGGQHGTQMGPQCDWIWKLDCPSCQRPTTDAVMEMLRALGGVDLPEPTHKKVPSAGYDVVPR